MAPGISGLRSRDEIAARPRPCWDAATPPIGAEAALLDDLLRRCRPRPRKALAQLRGSPRVLPAIRPAVDRLRRAAGGAGGAGVDVAG
jgi:hypothetical protein